MNDTLKCLIVFIIICPTHVELPHTYPQGYRMVASLLRCNKCKNFFTWPATRQPALMAPAAAVILLMAASRIGTLRWLISLILADGGQRCTGCHDGCNRFGTEIDIIQLNYSTWPNLSHYLQRTRNQCARTVHIRNNSDYVNSPFTGNRHAIPWTLHVVCASSNRLRRGLSPSN